MRERSRVGSTSSAMIVQTTPSSLPPAPKFSNLQHSQSHSASEDENSKSNRNNSNSARASTGGYFSDRSNDSSPYSISPWNQQAPHANSPWSHASSDGGGAATGLLGSLLREEDHIYSLAVSEGLIYTGSDSKNIRVWREQKELSVFKSSSGLVKAIVISGDRIFTGHQDGKIRVWKASPKNPAVHKRLGSLPRRRDLFKGSIRPSNYVEVHRRRSVLWIRHFDAVSCLSLNEDQGLLYSGSWDKTFKVWRVSDSRCLESVVAHDDAVNCVVAGFDGLVFTGSADGTVKAWRRELQGKGTRHALVQTLLKHDCAVTTLTVSPTAPVVYCGSSDGLLNFWEWERQLSHGGMLRGHNQAVLCLAAAGSLVLSGSADATICVWRREGGVHTCLSVLSGHAGPVKCLAIEEDRGADRDDGAGRWVVYSGSLDKSVKVWRVLEQPADALLRGPQHVPMEPQPQALAFRKSNAPPGSMAQQTYVRLARGPGLGVGGGEDTCESNGLRPVPVS